MKDDFPKAYGVPDFGVDNDIVGTQASLKLTEGNLENKWELPDDFKWGEVPKMDAVFRLHDDQSMRIAYRDIGDWEYQSGM